MNRDIARNDVEVSHRSAPNRLDETVRHLVARNLKGPVRPLCKQRRDEVNVAPRIARAPLRHERR
ncbi:hypothetical protein GCM10011490_10940 [Pseudoclavibacter endophyticus]|nr:hypothetical protein GCM10011490_10940 [Pseudoclavibacter endophyticus]